MIRVLDLSHLWGRGDVVTRNDDGAASPLYYANRAAARIARGVQATNLTALTNCHANLPAPTSPYGRFARRVAGGIALVIFPLVVSHFAVSSFEVSGVSMQPTLRNGDLLIVDTLSLRLARTPSRGNVVVFVAPRQVAPSAPPPILVKRVIGLSHDTIAIRPVNRINRVFVNGRALSEPYVEAPSPTTWLPGCRNVEGCMYEVPAGDLFVMGDNRPESYDSRRWGPVPMKNVVGYVLMDYWPLAHLSLVFH